VVTPLASHVAALMEILTPGDLEILRPAERRRFADLCRRCAQLAEPRPNGPKAGVLFDLKINRRDE